MEDTSEALRHYLVGPVRDRPGQNAAITFVEPLPVGLLIAGVSAAALRRRKGPADL